MIANAEYHRQIAEKERKLAEEAHRETQKLRDETEKVRRDLEAQRETAMKKAKEDARKVLVKAQREADEIISELKRSRKNEGAPLREHELHEMRARLQNGIDENGERLALNAEPGEAPKDLKIGESVEIVKTGTRATVVTPPDDKGEALVQAGVMKLKVAATGLKRVKEAKKERTVNTISVAQKPLSLECDLRGMTLDEALLAVDMFLDGAQNCSISKTCRSSTARAPGY